MRSLLALQKSGKTVFTTLDIGYLWNLENKDSLKTKIHYWLKTGKLKQLRKGIYALDKDYNQYELASCLRRPSYVSLETILARNSVIFQYSQAIQSISYISQELIVDNKNYLFRKIKDSILKTKKGLIIYPSFTEASLERAFLDILYLNPKYYVDNLEPIDWDKVFALLPIYKKKTLNTKIKEIHKNYAKS